MTAGASVLVTGADGRIGTRLLGAVDTGWVGASRARLDVTDRDAWRRVLAEVRPDVIVHLAGVAGAAAEQDEALARAVNAASVRLAAEEGAAHGLRRIVLTSSAAVYGDRRPHALRETDAPDPGSAYGRAKLAAEEELAALVSSGSLESAVALRVFNVTGPGMRDSLIARLLRSTELDPVTLRGETEFVRDYVHVDDVADALRGAATRQLPAAVQVVNVARGIPVDNRQAVAEVTAVRGSAPVTVLSDPLPSVSWADVSRARELLDLEARRAIVAE